MRFTPKSVRLKTLDLHNYTTTTPYPSWLTWKCSSKQPCQSPNFHSDNIYTSLMLKYYLFRTDFLTFPAFPCYLQLKAGNSSYVIAKYWLLVMVLSQKEQSEILWNSVLFSHVHILWRLCKTSWRSIHCTSLNPVCRKSPEELNHCSSFFDYSYQIFRVPVMNSRTIANSYSTHFLKKWLYPGTKYRKSCSTE